MHTYPAMNKHIVALLRTSEREADQYAAARIEELEKLVAMLEHNMPPHRVDQLPDLCNPDPSV